MRFRAEEFDESLLSFSLFFYFTFFLKRRLISDNVIPIIVAADIEQSKECCVRAESILNRLPFRESLDRF